MTDAKRQKLLDFIARYSGRYRHYSTSVTGLVASVRVVEHSPAYLLKAATGCHGAQSSTAAGPAATVVLASSDAGAAGCHQIRFGNDSNGSHT